MDKHDTPFTLRCVQKSKRLAEMSRYVVPVAVFSLKHVETAKKQHVVKS